VIAYAFTGPGARRPFLGDHWPPPGGWAPSARGSRIDHLPVWIDAELWLVELDGPSTRSRRSSAPSAAGSSAGSTRGTTQQYRACHSGGCPVGIATQDPHLRGRLDIEESAARLTRFLTGATAMMVDYARIRGRDGLGKLERSDLATLDAELARRTDLEWVV
jgi:hypothetical protein